MGLIYVFAQVRLGDIVVLWQSADFGWLLVAALLLLLSLPLRSLRWYFVLRGLGQWPTFSHLLKLYLVGNFFNAFLPSGFGGDVVRAWQAGGNFPPRVAIASVILDRFSGLWMLFLMALGVLMWGSADLPAHLWWLIFSVALVGLFGGILLWWPALPQRLAPLSRWSITRSIPSMLQTIQQIKKRAVWQTLAVSALFNLLLIAWWYCASRALHLPIPLSHHTTVVPLLSLALLLPSIGGLGINEPLAPLLYTTTSATNATALALTVTLLSRFISFVGVPLYLRRQRQLTQL